jgi:hypothetical protein
MQSVDNKLKLFFMSCAMAKEVGDIGFHLLEFQDVADSILNIRALGVYLPYIINQVVVQARAGAAAAQPPRAARKHINNGDGGDAEPNKRKKAGNTAALNSAPVKPSWINSKDKYGIFQANLSSVPKLHGEQICVKYHVLGKCSFGNSCQRQKSHTNAFDDKAIAEFDAWVKMCREKGNKD